MNLALINGEIDAYFTGGTYTASPARFDGALNVRGITPKSGPINGKGGIVWIELTSVVNHPDPSPLAEEFLAYVQRPDVSKKVAFAEGTYNPVTQMGAPDVLAAFDSDELEAIQWDSLEEELERSADYDINPDYADMYEIYPGPYRPHSIVLCGSRNEGGRCRVTTRSRSFSFAASSRSSATSPPSTR
jgi:spermidine/putrescine transport system substrate-binding protein